VIVGHWHTSFTVSDMDRSIAFYRDLLGLELVHTQRQANEYTHKLVGYANADIKIAMLKISGDRVGISGHLLELCEYVAPEGTKVDVQTRNVGAGHLALVVDEMQSTYDHLKANGVRFKSEPVEIVAGRNKGGYCCYMLDPDDITLELVQPPKPAGSVD
jgi:catechol 2,3-dioxygenase-like lactoylglutathione lyase family enzyme